MWRQKMQSVTTDKKATEKTEKGDSVKGKTPRRATTSSREPQDAYLAAVKKLEKLTRTEEISIARGIEKAEAEQLRLALRSPGVRYEVEKACNRFLTRDLRLRDMLERKTERPLAIRNVEKFLKRLVRINRNFEQSLAQLDETSTASREAYENDQEALSKRLLKAVQELQMNRRLSAKIIEKFTVDLDDMVNLQRTEAHWRNLPRAERKVQKLAQLQEKHNLSYPDTKIVLRSIRRHQRTSQKLKHRLIESHLKLTVTIARRYSRRGVAFSDLVQEGNLGLITAADKFDWRPGFRFSTYAGWWVRQSIVRAIHDQADQVRIPINLKHKVNRLYRLKGKLSEQLGREPSSEELAKHSKLTKKEVDKMLSYRKTSLSLDSDTATGAMTFLETLADPSTVNPLKRIEFDDLKNGVDDILQSLTERQREVVQLRFGLKATESSTLEAIGQKLCLTRERIRQIESSAFSKLKHPVRKKQLKKLKDLAWSVA